MISVCVTCAKHCFTRDQWCPVLLNVRGPPVLGEEACPSPVPSGSPGAGEDQETLIYSFAMRQETGLPLWFPVPSGQIPAVSSPGQGNTWTRQLPGEMEEGLKLLTCSQGHTRQSDAELESWQNVRKETVASAACGRIQTKVKRDGLAKMLGVLTGNGSCDTAPPPPPKKTSFWINMGKSSQRD